jgi:hypothetical protein
LDVQGSIRQTNATNCALSADANGQIICTVSSQRYKTNIRDLDFDIEKFLSLNPRTFDWNTSTINFVPGEKGSVGFIAEEVEKVFPELVRYQNGIPEGIKYEILPVYMFKVIQKQQKEIEELKLALNEYGILGTSSEATSSEQSILDRFTLAIKKSLEKLGLILENGIAKVEKLLTKEIIAEKITAKQICLEGDDGETICIDKNQLKQLLEQKQIQGSSGGSSGSGGSETPSAPTNQPPIVEDITVTTTASTSVEITLKGSDPDGDSLTYSTITSPTLGILFWKDSQTLIYTPNATGTDSFKYVASDGKSTSTEATVTINVIEKTP